MATLGNIKIRIA